ncbi:hypothetical protein LBUL87_1725 [Lactobacillus delbrueckii subsp. bulgaricus]|nr:hypothetical protein LBUL87_1725 [Lactobacillus delbrueckii subsp. bulgaricus]
MPFGKCLELRKPLEASTLLAAFFVISRYNCFPLLARIAG